MQKGSTVQIQIEYSANTENELKNYKATLSILSGPKYEFCLSGSARKPGIILNKSQQQAADSKQNSKARQLVKLN